MDVTKPMVIAGALLMLGWGLPMGAAHLAQNSADEGSGTSAGFGGPALDWDPCRKQSAQDFSGGANPAPILDSGGNCNPNNGVSGTYLTGQSATLVECLGSLDTDAPSFSIQQDTHVNCENNVFQNGWGGAGSALCDLEVGLLGDADNEEYVDNNDDPNGQVPDGTFDDGGFGGACHVSTYPGGGSNPANTDPAGTEQNPENTTNNAPTSCDGTAYAEDWVLGADVPIFVSCDLYNATSQDGGPVPSEIHPGIVNCLIGAGPPGGDPVQDVQDRLNCAQDNAERGVDKILNPEQGAVSDCTRDSSADVSKLGKGGGHLGDGVTVPNAEHIQNQTVQDEVSLEGCDEFGDIVVFVSNLVSANPFGQEYQMEHDPTHNSGQDEHFGWPGLDSDAQVLSDWNADGQFDGTGDTVVYAATGGWIDQYFDADTSPGDCHTDGDDGHNRGPTGLPQDDGGLGGPTAHQSPGDCGEDGSTKK